MIIIGAYERTDPSIEVTKRIRETVGDIGMSIFLTSHVRDGLWPGIAVIGLRCGHNYAVPSVVLVFLYTLTSFVALIVLDEQRIKVGRADCCVCLKLRQPTVRTKTMILMIPPIANLLVSLHIDVLCVGTKS
jgi:hypothetical protein